MPCTLGCVVHGGAELLCPSGLFLPACSSHRALGTVLKDEARDDTGMGKPHLRTVRDPGNMWASHPALLFTNTSLLLPQRFSSFELMLPFPI